MRDGSTTLIREGPRVWVGRNRVNLHNTRKILKKGNIVGILWEIPKKYSKNSRKNTKNSWKKI